MKQLFFIFLLGSSILFFSCKNDVKTVEPEIKTAPTATQQIDQGTIEAVTFKTQEATLVFANYIALKNALVQTDALTTSKAATALATSLAAFNTGDDVFEILKKMTNAKTIKEQRLVFGLVTEQVESTLAGSVKTGSFFKQYCPMAFNNKGGYWLSNSKDIRNPYFGDKMLKCGRVSKEIE